MLYMNPSETVSFSGMKVLFLYTLYLIVSGELPCTKEEAVTLADIQLNVQKVWPHEDDLKEPSNDIYFFFLEIGMATFICSFCWIAVFVQRYVALSHLEQVPNMHFHERVQLTCLRT